jgi:hypothetical protein
MISSQRVKDEDLASIVNVNLFRVSLEGERLEEAGGGSIGC